MPKYLRKINYPDDGIKGLNVGGGSAPVTAGRRRC